MCTLRIYTEALVVCAFVREGKLIPTADMAYIHTHSTLQDQMNKAQLVLVSQTWCRDQMESNQASATPKRRAHSFFCKLYLKPQTAAPGSV